MIHIHPLLYGFGVFLTLSLTIGRRAGCHAICWMSPIMIPGRKLRNIKAWSSLRLQAISELCSNGKSRTSQYPMSLDVNAMVQSGTMENGECILCATGGDGCPVGVHVYRFNAGR